MVSLCWLIAFQRLKLFKNLLVVLLSPSKIGGGFPLRAPLAGLVITLILCASCPVGPVAMLISSCCTVLRSWALSPIFCYFLLLYSVLSVTCSPLVPSRAARTATKSPDKSPDGSPDHSAVRYHMPSLRSLQHSTVSLFNPLWIASSLPHHDRPPAHDEAILRTASSWWTLLYVTVLFCDSCDLLLLTCI